MAEEPGTGLSVPWPPGAWPPGEGLGVADGLTQGNRPEALPAPMSWLEAPLRSGIGPSGRLVCGEAPGDDAPGDAPGDDLAGDGDAAETATVSAADGGVHFCVVAMLAVAVSLTEVTELALAATGICALSVTGCLSDTELTAQLAVPSPLRQPPVNAGFWLVGWAVRVTVTVALRFFQLFRLLRDRAGVVRRELGRQPEQQPEQTGGVAVAGQLGFGFGLAVGIGVGVHFGHGLTV